MTPGGFKRLALSLDGSEEGSHMGAVDFRVGGRIFATLASVAKGYGNVMLSPEQQQAFVAELPDVFIPVAGKWGEDGVTHIHSRSRTKTSFAVRSRRRGNGEWR